LVARLALLALLRAADFFFIARLATFFIFLAFLAFLAFRALAIIVLLLALALYPTEAVGTRTRKPPAGPALAGLFTPF
jgi:hypothetical protein